VELSHVVEAIRSGAEHELRELRCYLAAMAGDQAVSSDHNPFKPEGYARALWAAAQQLPLPQTAQLSFLRHAGPALTAVLRKSYAAACTRLEGMGVEPASYSTILFGSGAPVRDGMTLPAAPNLQLMRIAMPAQHPGAAAGHAATAPGHAPQGSQGSTKAKGSHKAAGISQANGPVLDFSAPGAPQVPTHAWPPSPGGQAQVHGPAPAPVAHRLGLFKGQVPGTQGQTSPAAGSRAHKGASSTSTSTSTSRNARASTHATSANNNYGTPNSAATSASGPGGLNPNAARPKERLVALPHWSEFTAASSEHSTRQAVELVGRLFEAMLGNAALPADVVALISRLHGPAMRLVVGDSALLDQDTHPLWRFIHRLVYEAQMRPLTEDPERLAWLQACQTLIEGLANDPRQEVATYEVALMRLEQFRQQRLAQRCTAAASQIAELGRLEERLCAGHSPSSTQGGVVDLGLLDTVPAHILARMQDQLPPSTEGKDWLQRLEPGVWVRLFIDGRWVHAQVLWPGERGELWLIADGASSDTWAVRRNAFLRMRSSALAKTLLIRSLVNSAAVQVQEMLGAASGPAPA
jgi:Protein of unknown function (DUF1631)